MFLVSRFVQTGRSGLLFTMHNASKTKNSKYHFYPTSGCNIYLRRPTDRQVVEAATEDYSEVQDLLKRFATLKDANKNLNEAQTRDEGETERLRSEFSNYTKER